ncbi:MAG: amino acid adenylation enzyme/thioester reductase family protein [Verrucomicrobiales bacterium]|nr:amino acid adenylation enzyme/thioester reductase family protein [Verrucomicrobiales bacterium]
MSQQLSQLSPEARALLEKRLLKSRVPAPAPVIDREHPQGPSPLSHAQESLWFLDQLEPGSPLYIIPEAWRIKGALRVEVLEEAFRRVIERHETLRTRFVAGEKTPVQVPIENWTFKLRVIDLRAQDVSEKESKLQAALTEEAQRPFHLKNDLLIRGTVIQLDSNDHALVVTLHHIISDAYSMALLYAEVTTIYRNICDSFTTALPPLPVQYSSFARDQKNRLQGEVLEKESAFWLNRLSGELPLLDLPTDRPRLTGRSFKGLRTYFSFPASLQSALKELSRQNGVTLYMTLLGAFSVLLRRYSGQQEILIGTPISTRNRKEYENLIGFFINTIVFRTDFVGDPNFNEVLQRIRKQAGEAFAHAEMPLYRLVERLKVPRHTGNPLFQVVFQYLATPTVGPQLEGCQVEMLPMETGTAKFDLTLNVVDEARGLSGNLEFNTDLFDGSTIERLLANFQTLLEGLVNNPEMPVSKTPCLSRKEMALVNSWNNTSTAYPRNSSIHQLFEEIVSRDPHAIAVEFEGMEWSYRDLNARSNQLARALRKQGVVADTLVGLCVPRSVEMIVSILGILKAGGAYTPLDPSYPEERLTYLISETGMQVLVTTAQLGEKLFSNASLQTVIMDKNEALILEDDANLGVEVSPDNLAYVLYTSGSTGKPKGVAIPQRGVIRLVKETRFMSFGVDDIFLQFAPISFDASTLEIWGSLLNGAKLVIFPPEFNSLQQLGEIIQSKRVSILWLTAGLFHQMVEEQISSLKDVRQLLAGGDVLSVPHVLKVLKELPGTQLINGYGPTENTTFTCCYSVPPNWRGERSVPIGQPISNTQVFILDGHMQEMPIGVPGQLYIAGDGLAREYLRAPELTREKFVPNPFPGTSSRLYKTGDTVRWLPDGNAEFVGRMDFQVKIRGFRVELGEIESALAQHPAVKEAIVLARADNSGTKQLVAFVVLKAEVETTQLRQFLQKTLPGHMVPGQIIVLEQFPLNANGKVDRKLLPSTETQNETKIKTPPRTAEEQTLVTIWAEVLGINPVGIEEDFFELGGHSLLATKIVSRINKEFNTNIPLAAIFDHPTIASLAEVISRQKQTGVRSRTIISRRIRTQGEHHDCTTSTH